MAVELYEKIDFKIKTEEKTSVYPILVKLELTPEDDARFEAFKTDMEQENKSIHDAAKETVALQREISRLREDIEDIEDEIADLFGEDDSKKRKKLKKQRREARRILRSAEDDLAKIEKEYDIGAYTRMKDDLVEAVARESFSIRIMDNEQRAALEKAIKHYGIKFSTITSEVGRLIGEAKKKKNKRS